MKRILLFMFALSFLSVVKAATVEQFTEYYAGQFTGASNLNAGSTAGATTYWDNNGTWYSSGSYTSPGANLSGVSVNQIASIYRNQDSTTSFIGVITSVNDSTDEILISKALSSNNGILASSSPPGISIRVGGAWRGPNGTTGFPFGFISTACIPTANIFPRVNFLATSSFSVTNTMTHNKTGPVRFQGYSSTPGDLGRASIDAGVNAITLLTVSGAGSEFFDLNFSSNGTSGTSDLVAATGSLNTFKRCVFYNARGNGLIFQNSGHAIQCEAYQCNTSNTAAKGGFQVTTNTGVFDRCFAHHNIGSNNAGFVQGNQTGTHTILLNCISANNGQEGLNSSARALTVVNNSDFYLNGRDGIRTTAGLSQGLLHVSNSNFIDNSGYGINNVLTSLNNPAEIENCAFGVGTSSNSLGNMVNISTGIGSAENNINYPENRIPWVNPNIGNFIINLTEAQGSGAGNFMLFKSTYAGPTQSYPNIGATQSRKTRGGYAITQ